MAQFITSSSTAAVDTSLRDNYTEYTKKSRHGHGQDVLDANNVRQVTGCLLLDLVNHRVMLISSRKNNDAWVLV